MAQEQRGQRWYQRCWGFREGAEPDWRSAQLLAGLTRPLRSKALENRDSPSWFSGQGPK
jgi:hypothetical protein